ncbi:hypothetical protein ONZ43_g1007 [Nemania bipapillata]|uniref:Uncharacterized protein n=1 Tax=Nemania bipapillata TaxID=110536 RepID=A0ACC2J682_9PEZI|nr:hypothetical protein ONZ43_g1007 [Nemania bipapillata]
MENLLTKTVPCRSSSCSVRKNLHLNEKASGLFSTMASGPMTKFRQGYEFPKHNPAFDNYYALVHRTITNHSFASIGLDIEHSQSGYDGDSMTLNDTQHLINWLRADFGQDFIITLAPVPNALLYKGSYNTQFYGGSWMGLKGPGYYERCINEGGWKPERIVTTITTSSDFTAPRPQRSYIRLNETRRAIEIGL